MKNIYTLIFFILAGIINAWGQNTFQKTYGTATYDHANAVRQTADQGYISAGYTMGFGAGAVDIFLVRTDVGGAVQWSKSFGGTGGEEAYSVQQTSDYGYIIVGRTQSFGAGNYDVYLLKTDASGTLQWSKTYGGSGYDDGYCVKQTADGGYIIAGGTSSFGTGGDVYLIKTDASGAIAWAKTFGGPSYDYATSVSPTADGGYIIGGYTNSFGAGFNDVYLIKTDSSGTVAWTKTFGGSSDDYAYSVQQTADGGYIAAGYTTSFGAGNEDAYLIKTNANGTALWTKTYGGPANDYAYAVQQTSDAGYILAGTVYSFGSGSGDMYLVKTDSTGTVLWSKTFGGTGYDYANAVQQTSDGGYIVAGGSYSFGAGFNDFYLVKAISNGSSACNETSPSSSAGTGGSSSAPSSTSSSGGSVSIPVTLASNGGSTGTLCSFITGHDGQELKNTTGADVFPNPGNGKFTIRFDADPVSYTRVEIFNPLGSLIYTAELNAYKTEIDLSAQPGGVYLLKLVSGDQVIHKKIIIQ